MDTAFSSGAPLRPTPAAQHLAVMAAAEGYFPVGWALVPLCPRSKKPCRSEWNHRANTVTTAAALHSALSGSTFDGNIGCALSYSHLCTIDIDNYEKAVPFFATYGINIPALMAAPDSVHTFGGKVGHRKLWFRLPADVPFLPHVKRDDSEGFELRCAKADGTLTLQDVLPPSIHPDTGECVRWEGTGDWRQMPVLPTNLLTLWRELSRRALGSDVARGGDGCGRVGGAAPAGAPVASQRPSAPLAYVRSLLAFIDPGCGYVEWLSVGMAMHANDDSEASLKEWDEWSHRSEKFKPGECEKRWASFHADGGLTINTLVQKALKGGYTGSPADARYLGAGVTQWREISIPSTSDPRPPVRRHLLHPLLPRGDVTLLSGEGGSGKSFLALEWAAHLAAGVAWGSLPAEGDPQRVLYVSMEDDAEVLENRIDHVLRDYVALAAGEGEYDPSRPDAIALGELPGIRDHLRLLDASESMPLAIENNVFGHRSLEPTGAMEKLRDAMAEFKPDLVIIDNASDAFAGDENNRSQVRAFYRMLRAASKAAEARDAATLLLAHVNKTGNFSGSTAWNNSARSRLMLVDKDGVITLTQEKVNHTGKLVAPIQLVRREGLLVPALSVASGFEQESNARAVLDALRIACARGMRVPASARTPHHCSASAVLEGLPIGSELPERLCGKKGRAAFWQAVRALQSSGEVVEVVRRTADRKDRLVLEPASSIAQESAARSPTSG